MDNKMTRKYFSSVEELRPYLDPLVKRDGHMPTATDLIDSTVSFLQGSISKFGGYPMVARLLDYPEHPKRIPHQRWRIVEDLRPHLDPIVKRTHRMPKKIELRRAKHEDLVGAIRKFGGFLEVSRRLGYRYDSNRTYNIVEDLKPELDPIVQQFGRMPTKLELQQNGWGRLRASIGKFGGFQIVTEKLGYPSVDRYYYPTIEVLREELDPIVENLGRMPSRLELRARGLARMDDAVGKFGTYESVAHELGYTYVSVSERASARVRRQMLSGQMFNSKLEKEAAVLLEPLGLAHLSAWVPRHSFDYGDLATRRVVEINGCYHHDHRRLKPTCPVKVKAGNVFERDTRIRNLAQTHGLNLLELWECERVLWPEQLAAWQASIDWAKAKR